MKTGGWYLSVLVITFLYFYIYAVNYVRGSSIPAGGITQVKRLIRKCRLYLIESNTIGFFYKLINCVPAIELGI